jgi:hypothetical protein
MNIETKMPLDKNLTDVEKMLKVHCSREICYGELESQFL